MYFLLCPRQGLKIEDDVLHRVYILGFFCPKQGQGLKPSAATLYPTIGQEPPRSSPPGDDHGMRSLVRSMHLAINQKKQIIIIKKDEKFTDLLMVSLSLCTLSRRVALSMDSSPRRATAVSNSCILSRYFSCSLTRV